MRKAAHAPAKQTQAKKTRVTTTRRAAPASRLKPDSVIRLNAADSRKLEQMLSRPAREPNDYVKAALADYRRLIQA